jgi:hypothetical protein
VVKNTHELTLSVELRDDVVMEPNWGNDIGYNPHAGVAPGGLVKVFGLLRQI